MPLVRDAGLSVYQRCRFPPRPLQLCPLAIAVCRSTWDRTEIWENWIGLSSFTGSILRKLSGGGWVWGGMICGHQPVTISTRPLPELLRIARALAIGFTIHGSICPFLSAAHELFSGDAPGRTLTGYSGWTFPPGACFFFPTLRASVACHSRFCLASSNPPYCRTCGWPPGSNFRPTRYRALTLTAQMIYYLKKPSTLILTHKTLDFID